MASSPDTLRVRVRRFDLLQDRVRRYSREDPGQVEATVAMLQIGSELTGAFDAYFSRHGLSRGRFLVLMQLHEAARPLSPAEIAEHSGCSRATMTGLLDTLEQAGLVRRAENPADRRMYQVVLTEEGNQRLEGMLAGHYQRLAALTSKLTSEERTQLVALLRKVEEGLDAVTAP